MLCYPTITCYPYSQCFQMILGGACDPETRLWAIKEIVKAETGPSHDGLTKHYILGYIKSWGDSEDSCKAIMSVLEERLGQPWPCNYKALDVLDQMPASALVGIMGKLKDLTEKSGDEGKHLKSLADPLLKKAKSEKDKQEAEEAKKREAAVLAAWGGLVNPAAITIACPPTLSIGCVPGGVNYYPHYLRPNLTMAVCPVMRCTPSWQPVKINDPPFHPAFSKTFNSAVYDVIRDPKSNIVTYTPVPKLGDNS